MSTPAQLKALQRAVGVRLDYWDALYSLEKLVTPNGYSDRAGDEVADYISLLAAGCDDGADATSEHVDKVIEICKEYPL
jgi:hypothetical protein